MTNKEKVQAVFPGAFAIPSLPQFPNGNYSVWVSKGGKRLLGFESSEELAWLDASMNPEIRKKDN